MPEYVGRSFATISPRVFGDPVANLFIRWLNTEMNGTDDLKTFEGRAGERLHDAYQPSDLVGILVIVLDVGQTRQECPSADATSNR